MKVKDETMVSFYQQLGELFYGIAQADNEVREKEIETLKKLVKEVWLDLDNSIDEFETDSAYQIEVAFDYLFETNFKFDNFDNLKDFKEVHKRLFTPEYKALILKTTKKIADSFSGINKAESKYIKELKSILNET
jgi:uncharacterized tellurite resistance protein B-like protein